MPFYRTKKTHAGRLALPCLLCLMLILLSACANKNTDLPSGALAPCPFPEETTPLRAIIDPASEVRGVYIATVYNIDYPSKSNLSAAALKAELDAILKTAAEAGLNTVYFQVRPAADALYESSLFPVSRALSANGKLTFDPLKYLIDTAHQQNIFVHAWVNPLRVSLGSAEKPSHDPAALPEGSPAKEHPEWTVPYADGRLYFDPGLPEVRQLVADGVREIVEKYNVDGILFDDYFYPYPVKDADGITAGFDDTVSYEKYGGGMKRADWRRQNINEMVKLVYDAVKGVSENVTFGVAPFGIWQNDDGKNGGSATTGMESYASIYCDPIAWARDGYVDYIAPQLYWRFSTTSAPFGTLARWWNQMLDGTGVDLLISHAAHNYDAWSSPAGELSEQVQYARSELTYRGSIFYGYDEIRRNLHGIADELSDVYEDSIIYADPSPNGMSVSVTSPAFGAYVNAAGTYLLGASSPDKPLTVNGQPVGRTRGGYFSLYVDLAPGENTFVFEQDGHTYTHVIYRGTPPKDTAQNKTETASEFALQILTPKADTMQDSGTALSVSCKAPAGAKVTAILNGQSVTLKQTTFPGKANSGWALATYSGTFPLPRARDGEIDELGDLILTATLESHTAAAAGGRIRVRGKDAFLPVQITTDHTPLKLGTNTLYYNDFSVQSAGMTDYAVSQADGFYLLRVGGYVPQSAAKELPAGTTVPLASLSGISVTSDGENTYISFSTDQNVPHNGTVRDGIFELSLYNVDLSTVPDKISVSDNPLIRAITVHYPPKANCVRFFCELYDSDNFYGFDFAYGDKTAKAILKNPRSVDETSEQPLRGIRIVLDAGHGGAEPGAIGPMRTETEADLNLAITLAAKKRLTALGAEVILTRGDDSTFPLTERIGFLIDAMPDLSISVHNNSMDYSSDITTVRGTLGLWWADAGVLLTKCVSKAVADSLFRHEITPRRQMLAMCQNPKFPSTLVEVGFMTSPEECDFMLSGGIEKAADGIAEGVLAYFRAQKQWIR